MTGGLQSSVLSLQSPFGSGFRVATALLLLAGPVTGQTLVSVEEEIEIGRAANAQMHKEVPELRDGRVASYVRDIGKRLARVAPGAKYPYSFTVADRLDVNAFSLPGGPIWLNRGVLQKAARESQVAAVVAHEIAHVASRHGADRLTHGMVARWGLGLLGALLGNSGGAGAAQAAATVLTGGVFLTFSRDEEREADAVGLRILTRAGWDGRGMIEMFELLERETRQNGGDADGFLSSHPSPQDRMASLAKQTSTRQRGRRDSGQFKDVKARLVRLRPPRPMHNR